MVTRVVDFECGGEEYRVAVRYRIEQWNGNRDEVPSSRKKGKGRVGDTDGEASSADNKEDQEREATKIVSEGEEY